ncbi:MAG: pyridine nucleotide-disulfide oxidoreductase [Candidatus Cloacimonadota bacterium]|nr:MAG: pyridine nucleotide-disulfide oxidoreductase [Candidatus Cloacimonadota bacterium]PIE78327.1 MAG: pyridine nucleotide-disulfide oxidoreductase [Candidatus Delongbacteria bacterium]
MEKYDIVIIGSGPAGFSAAMRGVDYKKKVCIIEKGQIGGAGIMHGAMTSKTLWELSCDYHTASRVDKGFRSTGLHINYKNIIKYVVTTAKSKQNQILSQIETFAPTKNKDGSIVLKRGYARIEGANTVSINNKETVWGDNIIIATGSRPRPLPGYTIDQKKIIDSDGILSLKKFPERMLIIGSGIIGCEYATIFSNFQQTEVHLLDRSNKVIPYEDDDVSDFVSNTLENNGVNIHHTANLREIRDMGDYQEVVLDYEDGHSKIVEVDVILVAIGRVPNTEKIGLENLGYTEDSKGFLKINDVCLLSDKRCCNVYAAGDITGNSTLVSTAELEGRFAVQSIFEDSLKPIDYSNMSTLMFFKTMVASVGLNEKQLRRRKIPYKVGFYHNSLVNRAIAMGRGEGFVKILISNDGENRILGMRSGGPQASSSIVSIAHLINQGNSLEEIMKTKYPHPSITEGIKECMRLFKGSSIYKEKAFPDLIRVDSWEPK